MARTSQSPFKMQKVQFSPKQTTVVVLCFVPSLEGYYAERFDILKLCLGSIIAHADRPYDLMVIDNGSVPEVVRYLNGLREEGKIRHLFLNSQNLGYGYALNMAFGAALGDYIAFANDDVLFHPHWLSKFVEVFETFPKTAAVSGQIVLGDVLHNSVEKVAKESGIRHEPFQVPLEWTKLWIDELGSDLNGYLELPTVKQCRLFLLEKDGVKAISGATGHVTMFRKEVIRQLPPIMTSLGVGPEDVYFHKSIDEAGYMRLCTFDKLTDHMGNTLNERLREKARKYGLLSGETQSVHAAVAGNNLLIDNRYAQRVLRGVFHRLYPLIRG